MTSPDSDRRGGPRREADGSPRSARALPQLVYGLVLRLFPRALRREYGRDMEQLFRDQLDETRGSSRARVAYWISALRDAVLEGSKERAREVGTWPHDARYAVRSLRRSPGFSIAVVITLALGIGTSTAIFSIVDGVLLRPLPYPEPDRLVQLQVVSNSTGSTNNAVSYPDFFDVREQNAAFEALVALYWMGFTITGEGEPERVEGMLVTPGFAEFVGLQPALGRWFLPEEQLRGNRSVVVLSPGLWERRYGADPDIIGKTIRLSGVPFTVIGVGPDTLPDGFPALRRAVLWMPLGYEGLGADELPGRGTYRYHVIGRLRAGVSVEAANEELRAISARLEELYPDHNTDQSMAAALLHAHATGRVRGSLWMMLVSAAAVLAIAVADATGLMLIHTTDRAHDVALRTALGASRASILSQLLAESLILSALGGLAGFVVAVWAVELFLSLAAESIPLTSLVAIDGRVLTFTVGVVSVAGAIFGTIPALRTTGAELHSVLQQGSRSRSSTAGASGSRFRGGLLAVEVALTSMLLIGAGLLMQSFWLLNRVDPGVATNVLTFRVVPPSAASPDDEALLQFQRELLERVRGIGGVEVAATISLLPMTGLSTCGGLRALDKPPFPPGQGVCAEVRILTPGYFEVMEVPLLRGRTFDSRDHDNAQHVVIINQQVAELLWPNENPLGRQLVTGWDIPRTVIGVVANVKQFHLYEEVTLQTYLPAAQEMIRGFNVVVRAVEPLALAPAMRDAVWSIDPDLPVTGIGLIRDYIVNRESVFRFRATLIAGFAAVSVLVAVVGIYGSIAYSVTKRRREMAIRLAVGAQRVDVMGLVMTRGMGMVALGLVAGLALSLAGSRLLSAFLFGVVPYDPTTFVTVALVMLAVALCANYLPARRAARTDPIDALRDG